jgi:hypothetical protein
MKTILIIGFLGLTLSACSAKTIQSNMKGVKNKSVIYQQGYNDGCNSGHSKSGNKRYIFVQDLNRFSSVPDYKTGWNEGFQKCR